MIRFTLCSRMSLRMVEYHLPKGGCLRTLAGLMRDTIMDACEMAAEEVAVSSVSPVLILNRCQHHLYELSYFD